MELPEVILPNPRDDWERDLILAIQSMFQALRMGLVGDSTIITGTMKSPLIIQEATPVGTIQEGAIWLKPSQSETWVYISGSWQPR